MNRNPLNQKINFIISIIFIGSAALLAMVAMFEASEDENPIATYLATVQAYENF